VSNSTVRLVYRVIVRKKGDAIQHQGHGQHRQ
jgi:hypothetical protein